MELGEIPQSSSVNLKFCAAASIFNGCSFENSRIHTLKLECSILGAIRVGQSYCCPAGVFRVTGSCKHRQPPGTDDVKNLTMTVCAGVPRVPSGHVVFLGKESANVNVRGGDTQRVME